jgi:nucleoside-diphosphate-sugar epimerase
VVVLVTGGTGYLGRHVARALASRGHEPVVFARRATAAGLPWRAVDGDVRDRDALVAAARGCDAICHAAAKVEIDGRPEDFDAVNVGGLRHAIAAVMTHGLTRLVHTSSFLAGPTGDGRPLRRTNDYQRTKALAARTAAQAAAEGAPIVVVAPGVVYGPGAWTEGNLAGRLLRDRIRGRLPATVGLHRTWSFSFVDDVAAGHALALERGRAGARYGLGGPNLPQLAMFEWLRARRGLRPPLDLPVSVALAAAALEQTRARLLGGTPTLTPGAVEILDHDWPVDSGPARQELGYRTTPFEEAMARTLADIEEGLVR